MRKLILFLSLFLMSFSVIAEDAGGDQDGFKVVEKGFRGAESSGYVILTSILTLAGGGLLAIGLGNIFSHKGRQDPDVKTKGAKQAILGAIFSAGAVFAIGNMFSEQMLDQTNDTVKSQFDETWTNRTND